MVGLVGAIAAGCLGAIFALGIAAWAVSFAIRIALDPNPRQRWNDEWDEFVQGMKAKGPNSK